MHKEVCVKQQTTLEEFKHLQKNVENVKHADLEK
jgi:hypothetical protein